MRVDSIGNALGSYPKKPVHKPSPATSATPATSSQLYKNKELFSKASATPSATLATHVATAVETAHDTTSDTIQATAPELAHDTTSDAIQVTAPELARDTAAETAKNTTPETAHDSASETPSERPLSPHQPVELPRLFSSMLMTDQVSGKPLLCMQCGRRRQVEGGVWWVGECDICGERKGAKSRCSIISQEWV